MTKCRNAFWCLVLLAQVSALVAVNVSLPDEATSPPNGAPDNRTHFSNETIRCMSSVCLNYPEAACMPLVDPFTKRGFALCESNQMPFGYDFDIVRVHCTEDDDSKVSCMLRYALQQKTTFSACTYREVASTFLALTACIFFNVLCWMCLLGETADDPTPLPEVSERPITAKSKHAKTGRPQVASLPAQDPAKLLIPKRTDGLRLKDGALKSMPQKKSLRPNSVIPKKAPNAVQSEPRPAVDS